ncbi:MAG: ABC transporter permease [Chloroflexi bacterium]|nr:ABC transporter permease [Chloroflexota bacterium]
MTEHSAVLTLAQPLAPSAPRRSWLSALRRRKNISLGGGVLVVMTAIALLAPLLVTQDPLRLVVQDRLQAPNAVHPFGTDTQGRDVFSRVVYGARLSLGVGFAVSLSVLLAGTLIGVLSGYFRRVDTSVMRVMDGMMAFPGIILAIAIMAARGPKVENVVLALSIVSTPRLARVGGHCRGAAASRGAPHPFATPLSGVSLALNP